MQRGNEDLLAPLDLEAGAGGRNISGPMRDSSAGVMASRVVGPETPRASIADDMRGTIDVGVRSSRLVVGSQPQLS